ncbi:MAG TPA: RHS repeat-associated core domain-containing protein [Chloroflexota bacterium]|nr:RHS repeat-associated core domain-containing protein [Chloroflexota bacterium]
MSASYSYDQADRLIGLTKGTTTASYVYNGDGLRISKTVNWRTTSQVWEVAEGMPLLIQDGTNNDVTGPGGLPVERITSNGEVLYVYQDQLGSTRALLNQSGQTVATFAYFAYGTLKSSTGTTTTPFGFAGQYTDAESGLLYLRARYYDPSTGQFTAVDPFVDRTQQPYSYTRGNPMNMVDLSGLFSYQYTFSLGSVQQTGGAANVMAYLQAHLGTMFPFSTGGCTTVVLNEHCVFVPFQIGPAQVLDPLYVSAVGATCFTLATTPDNHDIGPRGHVTFGTYDSGGTVYLQVTADAPHAAWWIDPVAPGDAYDTWFSLAFDLRQALGTLDPSYYLPFGPSLPLIPGPGG